MTKVRVFGFCPPGPMSVRTGFLVCSLLSTLCVPTVSAADAISRGDGFVLIWQSTERPTEATREAPYIDVPKGSAGFAEITYAKARGILSDDQERFFPDSPLAPADALRWIFRIRSVEPLTADGGRKSAALPEVADIPALAEYYKISYDSDASSMTRDELLSLMRKVDEALMKEEHEVSLYAEKFNGHGTAFGETFDMYALTAAHRTFPGNTLVRVTNIENQKSVIVRINDRGPYVAGRDMDLSLAAFTTIADRSKGKIRATFERLGDATVSSRCADTRFQQRIVKDVRLRPGIPHSFALGRTLSISSAQPFVIRDLVYPDGTHSGIQTWVTKGESFDLTPSIIGTYVFTVGTKTGRQREMTMEVVECGQ